MSGFKNRFMDQKYQWSSAILSLQQAQGLTIGAIEL